jgi:hypothetical protein
MNEIDLEQEFRLLMRMARKQVDVKVNSGELTEEEGNQLLDMIDDRTNTSEGWQSSSIYC